MFEEIIKEIKNNNITQVDLSFAKLNKKVNFEDIKPVIKALGKNTSVTSLNLSGMNLTDADLQLSSWLLKNPLLDLLKNKKNIIEINVKDTDITYIGLSRLNRCDTWRSTALKVLNSVNEKKYAPLLNVVTEIKAKVETYKEEIRIKDAKISELTKTLESIQENNKTKISAEPSLANHVAAGNGIFEPAHTSTEQVDDSRNINSINFTPG